MISTSTQNTSEVAHARLPPPNRKKTWRPSSSALCHIPLETSDHQPNQTRYKPTTPPCAGTGKKETSHQRRRRRVHRSPALQKIRQPSCEFLSNVQQYRTHTHVMDTRARSGSPYVHIHTRVGGQQRRKQRQAGYTYHSTQAAAERGAAGSNETITLIKYRQAAGHGRTGAHFVLGFFLLLGGRARERACPDSPHSAEERTKKRHVYIYLRYICTKKCQLSDQPSSPLAGLFFIKYPTNQKHQNTT